MRITFRKTAGVASSRFCRRSCVRAGQEMELEVLGGWTMRSWRRLRDPLNIYLLDIVLVL
jgi:hypothetical protein